MRWQQPIRRRRNTGIHQQELCETSISISDDTSQFVHERSGHPVALYSNHQGCFTSQRFQIGRCTSSTPAFNINSPRGNFTCRVAFTKVLADIYIPRRLESLYPIYRNCSRINNLTSTCRDWINIPTHCTLHFSSRDNLGK